VTESDQAIDHETRADVAEVLVRYATGIDSRDWDLLRTCFTDDCEADYGAVGAWHGADEITTFMRETHEPLGHTLHRITNQTVHPDGGRARARSYVDALVMLPDNTSGTRATGYYDDELIRTDTGWKIARRRFTSVLMQLVPDGTIFSLDPQTTDESEAGQ
jgi:3-phenylpropionate/cinnamic acid dioxygenase small subunit